MAAAKRSAEFLVLGGGASGLSAVYYLQRLTAERTVKEFAKTQREHGGEHQLDQPTYKGKNSQIALLEASSKLGGWIDSTRTTEGSIHETGPRSMRPVGVAGRNALNLAASIGLADEIIPVLHSHPAAQRRFIYSHGKLHRFPTGLTMLLTKQEPLTRPLAFDLAQEVFIRRSEVEDESLYDFGVRRFGKQITENLIDPFCRGIFAGRTTELSVRSCFPPLYNFERIRGSVVLGGLLGVGSAGQDPSVGESDLARRAKKEKWSVWTLKGGLTNLTEKLGKVVSKNGAAILTQTPCTKIEFVQNPNGGNKKIARVHTQDAVWETEQLISAMPAKNLAELLPADVAPLSSLLKEIPSVTVAVVNLEFDGAHLPTEGFGYLVPSHEPSNILGVIFDSCAFPQHDTSERKTTRITCMMGGAWFHDLFGDPDKVDPDWLATVALETLKNQIGLDVKPRYCSVSISKDCIPNYRVGHHRHLDKLNAFIDEHHLPLTLVGSSYKAVSVNDCIYNSRLAAKSLIPHGQLLDC